MRFSFAVAFILLAGLCVPAAAGERVCRSPQPVETIAAVFDAIRACWQPPAGDRDHDATVNFSLRLNGTIIGTPRLVHRDPTDRSPEALAFDRSILEAMERAAPLPLSDSLGGAIAGRLFAYRLTD
ncbi:energy transducer TonB [Aureimonas frigidaquae]|uniref:hypothetical protein n=1 Tax=Aureimonas frigidaquae TaxID=424757 RepID=UPI0007840FF2|nr:hypothetical protein [Aureimonas frigidaquae]